MKGSEAGLGIGVSLGAIAILAAIFASAQQNAVLISGAVSAVSLAVSAFRFRYERQEAENRRIDDAVQRLKPTVYRPLLSWALASRKPLMMLTRELIFKERPSLHYPWSMQSPPDLSEEPDFAVITGDHLKNSVTNVGFLYDDFCKLVKQVQNEYLWRLRDEIGAHRSAWDIDSVIINGSAIGRRGIVNCVYDCGGLEAMNQAINNSVRPIRLEIGSPPTDGMDCPDDVLKALQVPDDLASFKEADAAADRLQSRLEQFITELREAIIVGEKDWHIKAQPS